MWLLHVCTEGGKGGAAKPACHCKLSSFPSFISFGAFKYYISPSQSPCCHSNFHSCSSYFNAAPVFIIIARRRAHLRFTPKDSLCFFFFLRLACNGLMPRPGASLQPAGSVRPGIVTLRQSNQISRRAHMRDYRVAASMREYSRWNWLIK